MPKVSIVLRKSYGAGYFVMNGTDYEADYIAIWPTAEIAVMGPDGMVEITRRKELDQLEGKERDERKIALAEEYRKNIDPYIAAGWAQVDDVIDPADTRFAIWKGLQVSKTKQIDRPWRKHGVLSRLTRRCSPVAALAIGAAAETAAALRRPWTGEGRRTAAASTQAGIRAVFARLAAWVAGERRRGWAVSRSAYVSGVTRSLGTMLPVAGSGGGSGWVRAGP